MDKLVAQCTVFEKKDAQKDLLDYIVDHHDESEDASLHMKTWATLNFAFYFQRSGFTLLFNKQNCLMYSMADFQGKNPSDLLLFVQCKLLCDSMHQLYALMFSFNDPSIKSMHPLKVHFLP